MNNGRRLRIEDALELMSRARSILEEVLEEEPDALDSIPESLQYSERGEAMQEGIDALMEGVDALEESESSIYEACGIDMARRPRRAAKKSSRFS